jgi:predicted ester cyclase
MKIDSEAMPGDSNRVHIAPAYGVEHGVVDFILGITFEIWEQRQVEQILHYYSEDCSVFGLDGLTSGAAEMVEKTRETLAAYPDRLLLGDDVIWTGDTSHGFSSHRIISPMTNLGSSLFGPATEKRVMVMNIADCEINQGLITREWLVRDNLALVSQLGFDIESAAQKIARGFTPSLKEWLRHEYARVNGVHLVKPQGPRPPSDRDVASFAKHVLYSCWVSGDASELQSAYAPYCVLQRAPVRIHSGQDQVLAHYRDWRKAFPHARLTVDHVCSQPFDDGNQNIAVRWSVAAVHEGAFAGCMPSGKPIYIVGVTHWRVVDGRIAAEWTVFDELSMMAQTLQP